MIDNFKVFGLIHILSIFIPIILVIILIFISKENPKKNKLVNIILITLIIIIRSIRYIMDIKLGTFKTTDLLSLHVCNIDLYILIVCLLFPNKKTFIFTYLIGLPTALSVALFPGSIHPEPGLSRAIFFIMSHMMLVMSSIYLLVIYKFTITRKDLLFFFGLSAFGMGLIYAYNYFTSSNYLYLMSAPEKTLLSYIYNVFGHVGYILSLYILLCILSYILYLIYKLINKNN